MAVSDVHLGFEADLARNGVNLPSQTPKLSEKLRHILEEAHPDMLVIMGDLKHAIPRLSSQEWRELPPFFEALKGSVARIEVIPGNHDGGLSRFLTPTVKLASRRGILVGGREKAGLFHGHTWPSPKLFEAEVLAMGHNHPAVQFRGLFGYRTTKPIWLKAPIDQKALAEGFLKHRGIAAGGDDSVRVLEEMFKVRVRCSKLIILPAFNDLLGGFPVNADDSEGLLGPVPNSGGVQLGEAEIFLTDGTFLGTMNDLMKRPAPKVVIKRYPD